MHLEMCFKWQRSPINLQLRGMLDLEVVQSKCVERSGKVTLSQKDLYSRNSFQWKQIDIGCMKRPTGDYLGGGGVNEGQNFCNGNTTVLQTQKVGIHSSEELKLQQIKFVKTSKYALDQIYCFELCCFLYPQVGNILSRNCHQYD